MHRSEPPSRARRIAVGLIPVAVLCAFLAYLWFVSGVLPSVERYPDGTIQAEGYVARYRFGAYRRTGKWVTYHANGRKASEGFYEDRRKVNVFKGEKVPDWAYWDEAGNPLPGPPRAGALAPPR